MTARIRARLAGRSPIAVTIDDTFSLPPGAWEPLLASLLSTTQRCGVGMVHLVRVLVPWSTRPALLCAVSKWSSAARRPCWRCPAPARSWWRCRPALTIRASQMTPLSMAHLYGCSGACCSELDALRSPPGRPLGNCNGRPRCAVTCARSALPALQSVDLGLERLPPSLAAALAGLQRLHSISLNLERPCRLPQLAVLAAAGQPPGAAAPDRPLC